ATIGSTRVARRAGIQQATWATARRTSTISAIASGSTPPSRGMSDSRKRPNATAPSRPMTTPVTTRRQPWFITSRSTSRGCAQRDEVRDDAIEPDGGEDHAEDGETGQHPTGENEIVLLKIDDLAHGADARRGQVRIDLGDRAADGICEGRRRLAAHHDIHE